MRISPGFQSYRSDEKRPTKEHVITIEGNQQTLPRRRELREQEQC